MTILFTQEWDIIRGQEERYEEFIAKELIPKIDAMGLQSVGGFYVEVGVGPRIVAVNKTETLDDLYKIISTKEFIKLQFELRKLVVHYRNKILYPTGRVKESNHYEIQKGVWKYNQYYDCRPPVRKEYADFIINEYLPVLETLDYVEVTGGWNVMMGGEREIIGELTFKTPVDIGRLLENPDFREVTEKMRRNYVTHYTTRIMRTTERFDEPRWYRL